MNFFSFAFIENSEMHVLKNKVFDVFKLIKNDKITRKRNFLTKNISYQSRNLRILNETKRIAEQREIFDNVSKWVDFRPFLRIWNTLLVNMASNQ